MQVEESIVVHEETAVSDVTDYTDWSTYEGDSRYLFFFARCECFSGFYSDLVFASAAQDQSHIYPSHSYNTSNSPSPPVTAPKQEDYAGSRKNGAQENSVVNFPTATSDTITIHSGKAEIKFVSFSG